MESPPKKPIALIEFLAYSKSKIPCRPSSSSPSSVIGFPTLPLVKGGLRLRLLTLSPSPPEYWDCRHVLPCLVYAGSMIDQTQDFLYVSQAHYQLSYISSLSNCLLFLQVGYPASRNWNSLFHQVGFSTPRSRECDYIVSFISLRIERNFILFHR